MIQLELDLDFGTAINWEHEIYYSAKRLDNQLAENPVVIACDSSRDLLMGDCVKDENTDQLFVIQNRQWAFEKNAEVAASTIPANFTLEEYLLDSFKPLTIELKVQFPVQFNKK